MMVNLGEIPNRAGMPTQPIPLETKMYLSSSLYRPSQYLIMNMAGDILNHFVSIPICPPWVCPLRVKGMSVSGSTSDRQWLGSCVRRMRKPSVPARAFGDDNYLRLSYAVKREKITEGAKRIAEFVAELK